MSVSSFLGVLSGLVTAAVAVATGVLEGDLGSKFVLTVIPRGALITLGVGVVAGGAWLFLPPERRGFAGSMVDSSATSFVTACVVGGGVNLLWQGTKSGLGAAAAAADKAFDAVGTDTAGDVLGLGTIVRTPTETTAQVLAAHEHAAAGTASAAELQAAYHTLYKLGYYTFVHYYAQIGQPLSEQRQDWTDGQAAGFAELHTIGLQ